MNANVNEKDAQANAKPAFDPFAVQQFLARMTAKWPAIGAGLKLEIRCIPKARGQGVRSRVFTADKAGIEAATGWACEQNKQDFNCYFCVNPIRADFTGRAASDADIAGAAFVFADGDDGEATARMRKCNRWCVGVVTGQTPSVRAHGYIELEEPLRFNEPGAVQRWRDMQEGLIAVLDTDPAIKNQSRVMRLPGLVSWAKDGTRVDELCIWSDKGRPAVPVSTIEAEFPKPEAKAGPEPDWTDDTAGSHAGNGDDFFRQVNSSALKNIEPWVQKLFGSKAKKQDTGAWRVAPEDLGRKGIEEDLSIHPDGIRDFGLEKPQTAINLVIEFGGAADAKQAAMFLCDLLGIDPATLGWKGGQRAHTGNRDANGGAGGAGGGGYDDDGDGQISDGVRALFSDWCFIRGRNVLRNFHTSEECAPASFNAAFGRYVPTLEKPDGKTHQPPALRLLLNYLDGEIVHDTLYWPPRIGDGPFFVYDGVRYCNSYLPHSVPAPDPAWKTKQGWKECKNHLKNILPDDWEAVLHWLAHNAQHPGVKILWAPIICGLQGDGKTTLARILAAAMGHTHVRQISAEELHSDFNSWAEGSCVGVLEEIRVKGHNRHDAMAKLKPLITNPVISVVRKGQDGRNIPNCTNYLALTNHEDALALDADDRRWGVFFTRFKTREEMVAATGPDYWCRLNAAIDDEPGAIRAWLLSIDLSKFDAAAAPAMTAAKAAMIQDSLPEDEVAIAETIALGGFGVSETVVAADCLTQLVKENAHIYLRTSRLAKVLVKLGFARPDQPQMKWKRKRRYVWFRGIAEDKIRAELNKTAEEEADFKAEEGGDIDDPFKAKGNGWA